MLVTTVSHLIKIVYIQQYPEISNSSETYSESSSEGKISTLLTPSHSLEQNEFSVSFIVSNLFLDPKNW